MNPLIKKCYLFPIRDTLKLQCVSYSKKWPDDRWIIMNGLRHVGSWWQSQLNSMDKFCCRIPEMYPNMPPPVDPDSKFETFKRNLQPVSMKYWSARGLCTVRRQILAIQAMEWHRKTHEFIMKSLRNGIASMKSFLERNLLDDAPSTSVASGKKSSTRNYEGVLDSIENKCAVNQTQKSENPTK